MKVVLCVGLFVLAVSSHSPGSNELNDQTYPKLREQLLPKKEETQWQQIPWRPAFWQGVIEAQKQEKPLLVWAMNGHPLGCT
jgi:hypothetical protein